jgi:hypothetical protein
MGVFFANALRVIPESSKNTFAICEKYLLNRQPLAATYLQIPLLDSLAVPLFQRGKILTGLDFMLYFYYSVDPD